jgi:hypothetical protein
MIRKQGHVGNKATVVYGDTEVVNKSLFLSKLVHNIFTSLLLSSSFISISARALCIGHCASTPEIDEEVLTSSHQKDLEDEATLRWAPQEGQGTLVPCSYLIFTTFRA